MRRCEGISDAVRFGRLAVPSPRFPSHERHLERWALPSSLWWQPPAVKSSWWGECGVYLAWSGWGGVGWSVYDGEAKPTGSLHASSSPHCLHEKGGACGGPVRSLKAIPQG